MTIESDAAVELGQVTVTISAPSGFPGSVWNAGEYAFVTVKVNNTSGMLLRDVMADFDAYYPAAVSPIYLIGNPIFDGEEYWAEMEPGDVKSFVVRLKANLSGSAHTHVKLSAEVVPYAIRYHAATRDIAITPA